jgi:hypothetical protein
VTSSALGTDGSSTCADVGSGSGLAPELLEAMESAPSDPEHAERVPEEASKRKLRGQRVRALEGRARRDDASAWAILQGSAELSRVRRHRETIGVLIHRLIDARGVA